MSKLAKLNEFLNKIDVVDIAIENQNEYDIEAESLINNYNEEMTLEAVSELFTKCFEHFFFVAHVLVGDEIQELNDILKSQ